MNFIMGKIAIEEPGSRKYLKGLELDFQNDKLVVDLIESKSILLKIPGGEIEINIVARSTEKPKIKRSRKKKKT